MTAPLRSNLNDMHGVWTALITPFRADQQIDWDAFEKLLTLQDEAGVTGVVIAGTTGESPTLSVQEKLALIRKARAFLSPRTRLMAGTGDNNTQQSVELSRLAQDSGADSLLVVTPPYNKPSTAGLIQHYRAIAQAVQIPLCLYHVPGRTAHMLQVEQLAEICEGAGIKAIKEASGDLAFFARSQMRTKGTFLSGDDPTYLASLAVGGKGVISVAANIFPRAFVALTNAFFHGDIERSQAIFQTLLPAIDALFCEINPCPLKSALASLHLCKNVLRLPLVPISEANATHVAAMIRATQDTLKRILADA